jgi:hypothetical protein
MGTFRCCLIRCTLRDQISTSIRDHSVAVIRTCLDFSADIHSHCHIFNNIVHTALIIIHCLKADRSRGHIQRQQFILCCGLSACHTISPIRGDR